jgi:hypothetical protein
MPRSALATARLGYTCYPAGLMLGAGRDARPLLEQVKDDRDPGLDPDNAAEGLLWGALRSTCLLPDEALGIWPVVEPHLHDFLLALEAQAQSPGLARRIRIRLERLVLRDVSVPRPLTVGTTHEIRMPARGSIADVVLPAGVERLRCTLERGGTAAEALEVPVLEGVVPAQTLAEALAARFGTGKDTWPKGEGTPSLNSAPHRPRRAKTPQSPEIVP